MHGQRMKGCGERGMQADGAAPAACRRLAQRLHLVAADRGTDHHHRGRIETPAFDQAADGAVDAGTETVIVGAEPDTARRRIAVHSAAVRSDSPGLVAMSACFSLCSATK